LACRTCHSSAAFSHAVHSPEDRTRQLPRIIRRRTKVPRFQNRPRVGRGSWIAASSREKAARIFGGRPCRSDAWLSCAGSDELAPEVGNSDAFSFQVQNGPGLRGPYGPGPLGAGEVSVPNHSLDGAIVAKVCGGGEKVLEPNWVSFPGAWKIEHPANDLVTKMVANSVPPGRGGRTGSRLWIMDRGKFT